MIKALRVIILIFFLISCKTEKEINNGKEYTRWVGDIQQNNKIDYQNFKVCNGDEKVLQYFNLGEGPKYIGEKTTLIESFKTKYKSITGKNRNGIIRVRFIVNCEGNSGRFRVLQSELNYKEMKLDKRIITQLLEITKGIEKWPILYRKGSPVDYYFYLIFKIKDGQIIEILP